MSHAPVSTASIVDISDHVSVASGTSRVSCDGGGGALAADWAEPLLAPARRVAARPLRGGGGRAPGAVVSEACAPSTPELL